MNTIQKLVEYLRSAKAEALRVSWPSRQDTIRYSSLVIGVSLAIALAFAALDAGFTSLFNATLLAQVEKNATETQQQAQPVLPTTTPTSETPKLDVDALNVSSTGDGVTIVQ